jgi:hypothetical protein
MISASFGGRGASSRLMRAPGGLIEVALQSGGEERALAAEGAVEAGTGNSYRGRELVHRGRFVAASPEAGHRRFQRGRLVGFSLSRHARWAPDNYILTFYCDRYRMFRTCGPALERKEKSTGGRTERDSQIKEPNMEIALFVAASDRPVDLAHTAASQSSPAPDRRHQDRSGVPGRLPQELARCLPGRSARSGQRDAGTISSQS